jgi:hypothetical protein
MVSALPLGASDRALDRQTITVLKAEVEGALARGWRTEDLKAWFKREGVTPGAATASTTKGKSIDEASYHALVRISITGIPQWPFQPNRQAVLEHLDWLVEPARGDYGDAPHGNRL